MFPTELSTGLLFVVLVDPPLLFVSPVVLVVVLFVLPVSPVVVFVVSPVVVLVVLFVVLPSSVSSFGLICCVGVTTAPSSYLTIAIVENEYNVTFTYYKLPKFHLLSDE